MITPDGWLDWADRDPGPTLKCYSAENQIIGYVPHSAVGFYGGWAARLFSDERKPDGNFTPYAAASIHGWIAYDGTVTQHYPFTASCWGSGSEYPNTHFVAFENEGGFRPEDEVLTPAQVQSNARIIRELAAWRNWPEIRRPVNDADTSATLYEHNECTRFGSDETSCPSGRIPWGQILAQVNAATPPPPPLPAPTGRTVAVIDATGVVNVMDIDEYGRGVLPYEMATGWPMEALKAQAIVAKSYALAAGTVYTDTRSQVYGPARFPDTDDAVRQVQGLYLGFDGEIIMPFYFGHCASHTRTPSQAGWAASSNRPFLQGVECACGRTSYFGHGIGMCQRGAEAMAKNGATFDQILHHYYPGAQILGIDHAAPPAQPRPANARSYEVQDNDTLLTIAAKFGIEWPVLYMVNKELIADPNEIKGLRLLVPRGEAEEGDDNEHIVQKGDTLWSLSRRWNTTVDAIVAANSLDNEGLIRVGQRLKRPA